ncbi:MAG TPA: S53 family peptidase, partial [Terracidiphilus sp.]
RPGASMRMLKLFLAPVVIAGLFSSLSFAAVPDRIPSAIDSSQMVQVKGNMHGLAQARYDLGRADSSRMLHSVTLVFHPSAAQQQDLNNLLAEQQDRSSPNYHKWLTPAQFADRFGMSRGDIKRVTAWLQSQGFAVTGVANSRNEIYFDGTVSQVEVSFGTEIHNYLVDGIVHFANATNPSVPAALAGSVLAVGHLHDFAPKPRVKVKSNLTSYVSGNHFLSPGDFATIYDLQPLYSAGSDGTGETIAVVGQTTVSTTDLNNFRSAAGLPASTVTMSLIEGTATRCAGDEGESDLDLEWSGGVAKNASIIFLYAGLGTGDTCASRAFSVWDALGYAVQNNVAPIISTSYGYCESGLGQTFVDQVQGWAQQGNSQGQTIMAAAGDAGAADCDPNNTDPNGTSATGGLAVDVPASIPEVTGMGGNTFNGDGAGAVTGTAPNTNAGATAYWSGTTNSADAVSSALTYIPETAWNDTALAATLSATGGGASIYFTKPTWQTGTGVPNDGKRDVPDLSLTASPNHDGYLICSEDGPSGTTVTTCTSGFRTGAGGSFTIVGGTSAAAPTFSGILALINHYVGNSGSGNVNPTLYVLASTNPTAFHDVTTGNNIVPCTSGTPNCPAVAPFQLVSAQALATIRLPDGVQWTALCLLKPGPPCRTLRPR